VGAITVGDLLISKKTQDTYEVVDHQWSFCSVCVQMPHNEYCEKSKDPASAHYRRFTLRNTRTGKEFNIAGHRLDEAVKKKEMI
jgi:hypothetical protein